MTTYFWININEMDLGRTVMPISCKTEEPASYSSSKCRNQIETIIKDRHGISRKDILVMVIAGLCFDSIVPFFHTTCNTAALRRLKENFFPFSFVYYCAWVWNGSICWKKSEDYEHFGNSSVNLERGMIPVLDNCATTLPVVGPWLSLLRGLKSKQKWWHILIRKLQNT